VPPLPLPDMPELAPAEAVETRPAPPLVEPEPPVVEAAPAPPERPWQEELSERVESYRRRRGRPRRDAKTSGTMDFDFSGPEQEETPETDLHVVEFPRPTTAVDAELGSAARAQDELPVLEAMPLEKPLDAWARGSRVGETPLGPTGPQHAPVEIVVEPPETEPTPAVEAGPFILPLATLRQRFLAGLADAGILFAGALLFALIFWRAGGQLSAQPLNLAVLAFVAVFFVFGYFALSAAFTASTPGLLWMGVEIRNLDGLPPTPREALWRAFGYLVSIAALMVGFMWALVDSEGLTWHDRMSGTYLVPIEGEIAVESQESRVES
jgi:uncharacterized RDD family membrane protein YckC